MSTQWLSPHFTFATMGPADMILSRHVEILRADTEAPTLATIFGGTSRILYCPLGTDLSVIKAPAFFAAHGLNSRVPSPGSFADETVVRDVIRFEQWKPTDTASVWSASLASLVNKVRRVVTQEGQLNFVPSGWGGEELGLADRVDLVDVNLENVVNADGTLSTTWDLIIEFSYKSRIRKASGRIESLAVNGL